jgi:thioredoxin 1
MSSESIQTVVDVENGKSVLYFTANWCGPCQTIKPFWKAMADQFSEQGIKFYKMELDENREAAEQFQVKNIPAFFFVKDGEVFEDLSFKGADKNRLQQNIQALLQK